MSGRPVLVLASTSPRRRALLESLGLAFEVLDPGPDGPAEAGEPGALARALARNKARAGRRLRPEAWILAADTVVWLPEEGGAGRWLDKPADRREAETMLRALEEREHEVWTGAVLLGPAGEEIGRADRARVRFGRIPAEELEAWLRSGSWRDKAGAWALQELPGRWARVVEGWPGTVVGLAAEAVEALLEAGPGLQAFRRPPCRKDGPA